MLNHSVRGNHNYHIYINIEVNQNLILFLMFLYFMKKQPAQGDPMSFRRLTFRRVNQNLCKSLRTCCITLEQTS